MLRREAAVDSKSVRAIAIMGLLAILMMTFLMMFSLGQVTDASTPQIAKLVHEELHRSLDPGAGTARLAMHREATSSGPGARRYVLRVKPAEAVASDPEAVTLLLHRAAEIVGSQVEDSPGETTIRCIADLPDGGTAERLFRRKRYDEGQDLSSVEPIDAAQSSPR